jgi:GNAT superfamily N-acetyltransferase
MVSEHYTSNIYESLEAENAEPLYDNRYADFTKKGYEIVNPDIKDYDKVIGELYELITDLYSDFPIYKYLSIEDFRKVFNNYRYILNMSMVKMAYYEGKAVGFFVSVPDYGNKVYHLKNLGNLMHILKTKKTPGRYVMLYMGVHKEHRGLGKALVGSIMEELRVSGFPSIGALARDGKITQKYGEEHIEHLYEYVLLSKEL